MRWRRRKDKIPHQRYVAQIGRRRRFAAIAPVAGAPRGTATAAPFADGSFAISTSRDSQAGIVNDS